MNDSQIQRYQNKNKNKSQMNVYLMSWTFIYICKYFLMVNEPMEKQKHPFYDNILKCLNLTP